MSTKNNWEAKTRTELEKIVSDLRSTGRRVRAMGALGQCLHPNANFFDPSQLASERIETAAQVLKTWVEVGPDKGEAVVNNCVDRLISGIGQKEEEGESASNPAAPTYDPGEFAGHSRVISVPEVLEFLSLTNKTGMLHIATRTENFVLELAKGEVVHASSDSAPKGSRLGEILVAQGSITESKLVEFLKSNKGGEKLGLALQQEELISKEALANALGDQIQALFTRLFTSDEAYFIFREGSPENTNAGLHMNVTSLLLESATSLDEIAAPTDLRNHSKAMKEAEEEGSQEDTTTDAVAESL